MRRADIIVIAGIIAVAAGCYIFGFRTGKATDTAVITVEGKEFQTVSLEQNQEIVIKSEERQNIIRVEDGEIYMEQASCPDKVCIGQGRISKNRQTIVCLPNKVVIEVKGTETDFDTVAK